MSAQVEASPSPQTPPRAPDPILAELWEVKRQINAEAGYRLDVLARMAHEAAVRVQPDHSLPHKKP